VAGRCYREFPKLNRETRIFLAKALTLFFRAQAKEGQRKEEVIHAGNQQPVTWRTPLKSADRIMLQGATWTIAEHADQAGIPTRLLLQRINQGWSAELLEALLRIYRDRKAA